MFRCATLIALAIASLALAACGTSSGNSDEGELTKAEFIKKADLICEQTDDAQDSAIKLVSEQPFGEGSEKEQNERIVEAGLPPIRIAIGELEALGAPDGDEETVEAILSAIEEAVAKGEANPSTLLKANSLGPFAEASRLARAYGFKACAYPL